MTLWLINMINMIMKLIYRIANESWIISTKIRIFKIWISLININNMVLITKTCQMMIDLLSSFHRKRNSKWDGRGGNYPSVQNFVSQVSYMVSIVGIKQLIGKNV